MYNEGKKERSTKTKRYRVLRSLATHRFLRVATRINTKMKSDSNKKQRLSEATRGHCCSECRRHPSNRNPTVSTWPIILRLARSDDFDHVKLSRSKALPLRPVLAKTSLFPCLAEARFHFSNHPSCHGLQKLKDSQFNGKSASISIYIWGFPNRGLQ